MIERVDRIGATPHRVAFDADQATRDALARRFALPAIDRLHCEFDLWREGATVRARGVVRGRVTQACSVTDEPMAAAVDEPVSLTFAEDMGGAEGGGDELDLNEDMLDTLPIEDGAIDLDEAAAQTLLLALDPYPRGPNAAAALRAAGVIGEDEVRPYNAFGDLKAKLEGR